MGRCWVVWVYHRRAIPVSPASLACTAPPVGDSFDLTFRQLGAPPCWIWSHWADLGPAWSWNLQFMTSSEAIAWEGEEVSDPLLQA